MFHYNSENIINFPFLLLLIISNIVSGLVNLLFILGWLLGDSFRFLIYISESGVVNPVLHNGHEL